ncbi:MULTISPECIES: hypothetical protein [unclassified Streptomyces]|uniref:hypothetical protein n=1 Tax=unclassified Streptomyces TaxID=2593676 RepID=UPI001908920B|nr:hypothetical protein [Streptomyces sp. HSG2]
MSANRTRWNADSQRWESRPRTHPAETAEESSPSHLGDRLGKARQGGSALLRTLRGSLSGESPRGRRPWVPVAGLVVGGVVLGLVVTSLLGSEEESARPPIPYGGEEPSADPSQPTPGGTTRQPGAPVGTPSAQPTETPVPTLPYDYREVVDEAGFRIAVPRDWSRSAEESQFGIPLVTYEETGGERRLQIFTVAEPTPKDSFDLLLSDEDTQPAGFEQIGGAVFAGESGADDLRLDYRTDSASREGGLLNGLRVLDQRFTAEDGEVYAIVSYGPESEGDQGTRKRLDIARAWFCPPDHTCSITAPRF